MTPAPAGGEAPAREGPPAGGERRKALSGGLWNAAATVVPMGSTLALSVVIARHLGETALGDQSYVAFVASLLNSVIILSFTGASLQVLAASKGQDDPGRTAHLVRWSLWAHVAGGAASAATLLVLGIVRGDYLLPAWCVASFGALVDAVAWAFTARIAASSGWSAIGPRRLVTQAVSPLLGIALMLGGMGVVGVFVGQAIASVGILVSLVVFVRRHPPVQVVDPGPAPDVRPLLRLWGMFVASSIITQVVERRLEVVFLERYSGPAQIASYSVAFNVVTIAFAFCSAITGATVPSIATAHAAGNAGLVEAALNRSLRILGSIGVLLTAALAAVGPPLVLTFYGRDFQEAADLVPWLSLSLLLAPLGHLANSFWTGTARLRPVLLFGSLAVVVDVAAALVLVPRYDAGGAVAANVAAQCVGAVAILLFTARRVPGLRARPGRLAVAVVAAAAAAAAGTVVARALEPSGPGWAVLAATVVVALVFLLAGATAGILSVDDAEWLAGAVPGPAGRFVGPALAGRAWRSRPVAAEPRTGAAGS